MNKIVVAEKIMEFRQKNKLTQGEFGDLLGVSAQAILKWERELCYPDITILPYLPRRDCVLPQQTQHREAKPRLCWQGFAL